jgi:carbon-monoxide dehydrogenase iron sulfur subunit
MDTILYVDIEKCLACKSCEIACAVEHSQSKELMCAIAEEPRPRARVSLEEAEGMGVPLQCRQCEDAPCIRVCPTKAIVRVDEKQPVTIEDDKCIGCRWCVIVCPFGVITVDENSKVAFKCDMCMERQKEGELPACVAACPTKALQLKKVSEVVSSKRKKAAKDLVEESKASK